ncbi:MAG TPA: class I SAM-dependent methyltransferase [Polyangiaceae bacterium]
MSASTGRFTDRVDDYVRYRPRYPDAVLALLERELELVPERTRVVDIGTGTGISAELFLHAGYSVVGVEPNAAMRATAERLLASYERFRCVDGAAEATNLPAACADLVVAAQAFHWFDRERARDEVHRILAPGGGLALLWNGRKPDATPFLQGYEATLRRWASDYTKVNHQNLTDAEIASFFAPGTCALHLFSNHQDFDWEGLLGRALSSSYVPARGQPGHDDFVAALRELFLSEAVSGRVRFEYDTKVYVGTLDSTHK